MRYAAVFFAMIAGSSLGYIGGFYVAAMAADSMIGDRAKAGVMEHDGRGYWIIPTLGKQGFPASAETRGGFSSRLAAPPR